MVRMRRWLVLVLVGVLATAVMAQPASAAPVSLTGPYSQDFNTLALSGTSSTVPAGWEFIEGLANANTTYTAGTGSATAGDTYSFGSTAASERAFGGLQSGTLLPTIGAGFTNDTGATITSLDVSYTGEQWRLGAASRTDRLDFQYSLDATSVTSGTWTDVNALDFTAPNTGPTIGALDGNAAANRIAVAGSIPGLSIAPGATLWIRWNDLNAAGSDDGLSVDDFSLTPQSGGDAAPSVSSTTPADNATSVSTTANVSVTFSEAVNVAGSWFTISCASSGAHTATVTGGPTTFTLDPDIDFSQGEVCTVTVVAAQVTDQDAIDPPDSMVADYVFDFTIATPPAPVPIHDIQGSTHISPLDGQAVSVQGIVTATRSTSFYMQDPSPDANDATSEGIFVFTTTAPGVAVGDSVSVVGTVDEFRPGGVGSTNLTITEITSPAIAVASTGNPLPVPTVVGLGGRTPPAEVIEDDATGDVETSGVFDPATDGIDFYESLESMRVQINNPVAVGPTSAFGEIPVLADDGAGASVRTARGGIVVRPSDFNPERIFLDDTLAATPSVNVGDHFTGPAIGVLDYTFGNFKLLPTAALTAVSGGLTQETTTAPAPGHVAIGTLNVENLDPGDPQSKFDALAAQIVTNLQAPDIVALEEVQDNNGPVNDTVTDASVTLSTLISRITAAGGPSYAFAQINPVDDQDGGEPGGNIRVAFIYRSDRGLSFVSKPGGTSTTPNTVGPGGLTFSPGRIDPANAAFNTSRKPLAAEFMFAGVKLFLIANHFNSKGGDQPLFGHFQPPTLGSEVQRNLQAQVVNSFVDDILAVSASSQIVVLGDFNDFEFSPPLQTLKGGVLTDLVDGLPQNERYSYVFEGNSQTLDHILVSTAVSSQTPAYDIVHTNSEFAVAVSDHEPQVMRFDPSTPTAVRTSSLTAARWAKGVVLRWRTGTEVDTLGFHVYRAKGSKRLRVTKALIHARGKLGGASYRFVDRTAPRATATARYWLEELRTDGTRRSYRFTEGRQITG